MLTTRRLARHGAHRLTASTTTTTATSAATKNAISHHRVYLTKAKPSRKASQHVRNYQSTLKHPYYANAVQPLVADVPAPASLMRRAFRWYSKKLSTHPLLTKSLTGAIIAAAGDILCQAGTYSPSTSKNDSEDDDSTQTKKSVLQEFLQDGWDYRRSLHFFVLGLTFVAPTSHYWYGGLAKHAWTKGQSLGQISKRVALDQFVWTPVFFVIWLGGFWSMEQGEVNPTRLQEQLVESLPEVMVANWILWIPAQYLNFYACPVKFQVLFVNVIELAWNAYLSFAASGGGHGHGHSAKAAADEEEKMKITKDDVDENRETNRGAVVTV